MAKRGYKFTNKKHPPQAIASMMLGLVSLLGMAAVIYLSSTESGVTRPGYGLTGLLSVIFTVTGLILGILSLKKRDSFRILGYMGSILNGLVLAAVAYLFFLGTQ